MADMNKIEEKLTRLMDLTVDLFIQKAKDGDLSANEQRQVIQLLRDNGVNIELDKADPLKVIAEGDISGLEDEQGYYTQ